MKDLPKKTNLQELIEKSKGSKKEILVGIIDVHRSFAETKRGVRAILS